MNDDPQQPAPPMTRADLDAIAARNDPRPGHRREGDSFYSCPAHPEYQGLDSTKECDCDLPERLQTAADIRALLAEVERLRTPEGCIATLLEWMDANDQPELTIECGSAKLRLAAQPAQTQS